MAADLKVERLRELAGDAYFYLDRSGLMPDINPRLRERLRKASVGLEHEEHER